MDLSGKRVLVVGIARSGLSAMKLLAARGARVFATDIAPRKLLGARYKEALQHAEQVEVGAHCEPWFGDVDLVVVSPGVPLINPSFEVSRKKGIPIISEVELAVSFIDVPILAVTGSNGKSTTVDLAGDILENSGLRPFVGGNFGRPLCDMPLSSESHGVAVVEMSSFQLEAIDRFHPKAVAITNLTPNHQDRYPNFEAYVLAKKNIFKNMKNGEIACLNANCGATAKYINDLPCSIRWFGDKELGGAYIEENTLFARTNGNISAFDVSHFRLPGAHNRENLMAAALLAFAGGASEAALAMSLSSYGGLHHRLELVRERAGVRFINDSKATSTGAVETALAACPGPVILLLGGRDKGGDFASLEAPIRASVRELVTFGEAGEKIALAVSGFITASIEPTMEQAFARAVSVAQPGETILLSPGCASQDAYTNFEERGDHFRELANGL